MASAEVDTQALHAAVDQKRAQLGLSWRELSRQLEISPSTFSRMTLGHRPDVDTFATLLRWLGMPAAAFTRPTVGESEAPEPLAVISSYLRAAKNVTPEDAAALEDIIAAAYRRLVRDR